MNEDHKGFDQLNQEIEEAKQQVEVGGRYIHYKDESKTYTVQGIVVNESDDEIYVRYSQDGNENIEFVRSLTEFTMKVDHDGEVVERFKKA